MTKSCSCLDGRLTQSCSSALSLHPPPPLNNTILPPKIKLYLYLYNTPPLPTLPSRSPRGLCYRQETAGARWLRRTSDGARQAAPGHQAPLPGPEAGGGGGVARGGVREAGCGESNIQPHTLKRLGSSEKGAQGAPWHSVGRLGLCNAAGRTQTLERGRPVPPTPILGARVTAAGLRAGRQTPGSQSGGVLRGRGERPGRRAKPAGAALIAPCSS